MENIIEESPDLFKQTSEYKENVLSIKERIKAQYSKSIINEKSFLKKLQIFLKSKIEIYRKIRDLTSYRNMY